MNVLSNISIYDHEQKKVCDLYDSELHLEGQAYRISTSKNWDGISTLTFSIPYKTGNKQNFRWKYLKNEYMILLNRGGKKTWFIAGKPTKSKSGKEIIGTVTCKSIASLLKTKNIYLTFTDKNGIGTIDYLMNQILNGTGWHLGYYDTILEDDGSAEKVRSLKSDGKEGALGLINTVCNLFKCIPEYDTEAMTVNLYSINNRSQVMEIEAGKNTDSITVNYNSEDIVTRLYVEGEYGDFTLDGSDLASSSYVGIEDVNPTGLNFLFNFDYYKDNGMFTSRHQSALDTYLRDIAVVKDATTENQRELLGYENEMNDLVGQCVITLYYTASGFDVPVYTYGNSTDPDVESPTEAQRKLRRGDTVVVLNENGTYRYETITTTAAALIQEGDYGIAKFAMKASGILGSKEMQVEAKEKEIANLEKKIDATTKPETIAEYQAEITALQDGILAIYEQTNEVSNELRTQLEKAYVPTDYAGNPDLTDRIIVPASSFIAKGWTNFEGDYGTLYSQTYTAGEGTAASPEQIVVMTCVRPNGTVLSKDELDAYLAGVIARAEQNHTTIMASDPDELVLRVDPVKEQETEETAIYRNDQWAINLHELQEMWDAVRAKYNWFGEDDRDPAGIFDDIKNLYTGGLYRMMHYIMNPGGLMYQVYTGTQEHNRLIQRQAEIEATFVVSMGNLLRDGYWQNNNYIPGQEKALFADAQIMSDRLGKPTISYGINYLRAVDAEHGIPIDDLKINQIARVLDDDLEVYDNFFIKKITIGIDNEMEGQIEISNQDISIEGNDLGSILSRMSQLSDLIEQKNALYERAKAISANGTIYADRLNGQIDVLRTQLLSTMSNWYTDEQGNIMFLSSDGGSAMMLCGAGFMIASNKDDDGEWNWRTKRYHWSSPQRCGKITN